MVSDNAPFGHLTLFFAEDCKEMYQELLRMCTTIVRLIYSFAQPDVPVKVAVVVSLTPHYYGLPALSLIIHVTLRANSCLYGNHIKDCATNLLSISSPRQYVTLIIHCLSSVLHPPSSRSHRLCFSICETK